MRKKKSAGAALFILFFFLLTAGCLSIGTFLDEHFTLSGVTEDHPFPQISRETLWDGSFQEQFNSWFETHFPGRNLLIQIRGQLMYSLVRESPNENAVIGKDDYIFGTEYIAEYLPLVEPGDDAYFTDLKEKLERLQTILGEYDKELYIFITPSKAHLMADYIPWRYKVLKKDTKTNYQRLRDMLEGSDLNYFDCCTFIEQSEKDLQAPLFYSTGVHWSRPWGMKCAVAFSEYLSQTSSRWDLSTLSLSEMPLNAPEWPDADIYSSMNLLQAPHEQYFTSSLTITEQKDTPNVFLRGGSFIGASLASLINAGVFNHDVHYENNFCYTDRYSNLVSLSSFTSYDEIDLDPLLGQSDILILEVNEAAAGRMSFGFIDYVMEYPELLDRDY